MIFIIFVYIERQKDFLTKLLISLPAAPCCRADMGIVLKIVVVPGLVVLVGDMPLMPKIVGLFPVPPAWLVVIMVVCFPSADVTSFRMVPGGKGPFVYEIKMTLKLRLFQIIINVSVSET